MTTRMQLFDFCVAKVFARLYESFPERIDFDLSIDVPLDLVNESDLPLEVCEKFRVFEATVIWLHQAGYIWAEAITPQRASRVVLSPKALEVLKVPSLLSNTSEPLGQTLVNAVKTGTKDAIREGVGTALREGFKLIALHWVTGG